MTKVVARITNYIRLPFAVSKGTEAQRFKKSEELSYKLFKELNDASPSDSPAQIIRNLLKPYKIRFSIMKNQNPEKRGALQCKFHIKSANKNLIDVDIVRYRILLSKNKFGKIDKYTLLHEAGHMFDYMFNPKLHNYSIYKFIDNTQMLEKIASIKENFLDNTGPLWFVKKEITKLLQELPDELAIDTLQSLRAHIKTEMHQYSIGVRCMLFDKSKILNGFMSEHNLMVSLNFKAKLRFANKLLKKRLMIARKNIANSRVSQSGGVQAKP